MLIMGDQMLPEIEKLKADSRSPTGWNNFKSVIEAICIRSDVASVLEIGGGRSPLLSSEDVKRLNLNYTVNDISERELQKCPDHAETLCFDIAGIAPSGQFNFIFQIW